jgi:hypothetical protein
VVRTPSPAEPLTGFLDLAEARDVKKLLVTCIHDLQAGRMEPKVANAVGYLSGLLLKAFEQQDLAAELAELKREFARRKPACP